MMAIILKFRSPGRFPGFDRQYKLADVQHAHTMAADSTTGEIRRIALETLLLDAPALQEIRRHDSKRLAFLHEVAREFEQCASRLATLAQDALRRLDAVDAHAVEELNSSVKGGA